MRSEFLNNILNNIWLTSLQLQEELREIRMVFILFGLIFLGAIFYLLFKSSFLRVHFWQDWMEFLSFKSYDLEKIRRRLERIQKKMETGLEADWKMAVLESRDLLNEVLERNGYQGKTLEERLEKIEKDILPNKEEILRTHRIYENMIADPDYHLTLTEAKKFLDTVEGIFKNLGII